MKKLKFQKFIFFILLLSLSFAQRYVIYFNDIETGLDGRVWGIADTTWGTTAYYDRTFTNEGVSAWIYWAVQNQAEWYEINDGKSFDFTSYDGCTLTFNLFQRGNWGDTLDVLVSTNGGGPGGTWTIIARYINNTATPDYLWQKMTVSLTAYDRNSSVNIAFRYKGNDAYSVGLDNITITGYPYTPNIEIRGIRLDPNGNYILSPGESNVPVIISLRNRGTNASNVQASLSTSSSYITVLSTNNPWNAGDLNKNNVKDNSSMPFYVNVSGSAPDGHIATFSLSITASGGYSATRTFTAQVEATPKPWTIIVYIGGDNNLGSYADNDVDEMEQINFSTNVEILVQLDGHSSYQYNDYLGSWATVRRYRVEPGNTQNNRIDHGFIQDLGELNSEDPQIIKDFIFWAMRNYPAKRYALILWNHGAGWAKGPQSAQSKGLIFDDTDGDGNGVSFSNGELVDILEDIRDTLGRPLDILGFDACVVGMHEIENELLGYVDYIVHSEANIPANGFNYNFVRSFANYPNQLSEFLADSIVMYYAGAYGSSTNWTLSNIRLDHSWVNLWRAVGFLAKELIDGGGKSNSTISDARNASQTFTTGDYYKDFIDLYDFANELDARYSSGGIDTMAQKVKDMHGWPPKQADRTVRRSQQYGFADAHGIAIYYPTSAPLQPFGGDYHGLKFGVQSVWTEFIYNLPRPGYQLSYYNNSAGDYIEVGQTTWVHIGISNTGTSPVSGVWAKLSTFDRFTSIIVDSVYYEHIPAGGIGMSYDPFVIIVNSMWHDTMFIPFELSIRGMQPSKFILTAVNTYNSYPLVPSHVSPFPNAYIGDASSSTTPTLTWNVPKELDGSNLHFRVQWDDDPNFGSPATVNSATNTTGFSPTPPRPQGTGTCSYTINSQGEGALTNGTTYWWRVQAYDGTKWGMYSRSTSFTVNTSLSQREWFQTTTAQFETDLKDGTKAISDKVILDTAVTLFTDNFEGSWPGSWSIHDGDGVGNGIRITRTTPGHSPTQSIRVYDATTSYSGGFYRTFTPLNRGTAIAWAYINEPTTDDCFILRLSSGGYGSPIAMGFYIKDGTLYFYNGVEVANLGAPSSGWHEYKISFDCLADTVRVFVDGIASGTYSLPVDNVDCISFTTYPLGNSATCQVWIDDVTVYNGVNFSPGLIASTPIIFSWVSGATAWDQVQWTQGSGDSIIMIAQYRSGGNWVKYDSAATTGTSGTLSISGLSATDTIRLLAKLYRKGADIPELFDWRVKWAFGSLGVQLLVGDESGSDYGTWALGMLEWSETRIMNSLDRVYVKNTGTQAFNVKIKASPISWAYSDAPGNNQCVLMALFNGNVVPTAGDFSTTLDTVNTNWRTSGAGASGNFGSPNGDGVNIPAGGGEKLYFYFRAPSPNTIPDQQNIQVDMEVVPYTP